MKSWRVNVQMKATEQYFPMMAVYYAVQDGSNFRVCWWNPEGWAFKWKLLSNTFLWWLFIMLYKMVLTFECGDEILKGERSNESYWAVLSCGVVCFVVYNVQLNWLDGGSNCLVCARNPTVWPFKSKLLIYKQVLSCGAVYHWCCTRWF